MSNLSFVVTFAVGAVVGSVATSYFLKKHYSEIADEEIQSVKEAFARREEEIENITNEKVEKRAYEIITERYTKPWEMNKEKEKEKVNEKRPYVIPPEEYGETDYETVILNYYDDEVLTYENDDVIENVDELVGKDSLSHFGEYEADTVYVRNDALGIDYEILADTRRYEDIYCS